ncbi:MAG: T9SS type A sorting domain-containing protein [Sphingobacteriales bacterium]|jgi:hypothetical protein|nr:T9SS type A sorting domain-containing protein [Sphingobacteriales bacterium]MBP9140740.1 T9SS type A sorting domain-containing protein [Chitinophagales bacterium]MDA0197988.1 T9SS type A sorting domain-containing protein [Bacteroidota bacterium]MBK6890508.1 T9SS type A sorting domain-containing protein [Sphingobacteriales bacterium]MBK7526441.1 T9SS type A sorting domain-containing protein [Sphingobacteriales bacterium]
MKTKTLFLCLMAVAAACSAQNVLTPEWVKSKASPVGGNAESWGIAIDQSGNFYWTVSVDSSGQGLDILCYKFDADGNSLWTNPFFYGGASTQHAFACNAKDTALYIGGRYCPLTGFSCDMLLLKVDKNNGSLIWGKTKDFGYSGYDEVDGLVVQNDGIYCTGWAQALQTGPYQLDIGLWKVDFNGNTIWSNYFGKASTAEHQDGHIVIDANNIYCAGLWDGKSIANAYNGAAFVGKFSKTDGSFIDSTLFGYPSNALFDAENALGMATDGTYLYLTGYTTPVDANDWQIFVAKFDKNLQQIWYQTWGGSSSEAARGIAVSKGKVFVAGVTQSPEFNLGGAADAVLLVYDTTGNFIAYKTWGDTLDNGFRDIAILDDAIYISGSSGKNLFGGGSSDNGFAMKVDLSTILTSINEIKPNSYYLNICFNPSYTSNNAVISTNFDLDKATLAIYNISGEQVFSIPQYKGKQVNLHLENLRKGIYILFLAKDGQTVAKKFIID